MRSFEYSCRDLNGQIKKGILEAQDRSSALLKLKSQGCVPISVSETLQKTTVAASFNGSVTLSAKTILISLLVVLACIAGALYLYSRPKSTGLAARKGGATARVSNGKGGIQATVSTSGNKVPRKDNSVSTGAKGKVSSKKNTSPGETPLEGPTIAAAASAAEEKAPLPQAELKSDSEQLIAMLGLPGEEMPPLPIPEETDLEKDFANAATNTIVIKETDDERTAVSKENVAWVKTYIAEAKRMGWTPAQYIKELENTRKHEALQRNTALRLIEEIERDYPNDVAAAREALNKELMEKGLLPLDEPTVETP